VTGVGSFVINGSASVGATDTGQIVVTYDRYSIDPNAASFDPIADLIATGNFLTAPASVAASVAPEPSYSWPIMALTTVWLGWRSWLLIKKYAISARIN
jgi:hypothetical protein